MKILPYAEFEADFPDDMIVENNKVVEFAGRAAAAAIAEILEELGCAVEPPEHEGEHGWNICFKSNGEALHCLITLANRWLLLCEGNWLFGSTQRTTEEQIGILRALNKAFALDPRFGKVRWYSQDEVLQDLQGAEHPIVGLG